jgi:uncharacterized membrane protein
VAFCPNCGSQTPAGASACPNCAGGNPAPGNTTAAAGLDDNIAGMLCYLFIPAILFLVLEPYNKRRFIRFHAFQCIFLAVALFVLGAALSMLWYIPILGWVVGFLLWPLVGLGELILWIVLLLKAYQGQMFKLPVIGDMAEKQADAH